MGWGGKCPKTGLARETRSRSLRSSRAASFLAPGLWGQAASSAAYSDQLVIRHSQEGPGVFLSVLGTLVIVIEEEQKGYVSASGRFSHHHHPPSSPAPVTPPPPSLA